MIRFIWNYIKHLTISLGDIPNSSSIDILMPYAIFDNIGAFLRSGFAHVDNINCYPRDQSNHMAAPVKVARQQITPELSRTFWTLPPEPAPTHAGNLPRPSGTNLSEPSGTYLRNLRQHTPEPSEIFQNLRELACGTYTSIRRNPPEPSGTRLRNLHQHTPELSGTFPNPPPELTPAHTGTLRNLPEPSSGTCSSDQHRHTPELIWAEDPISLRCWGKSQQKQLILVFGQCSGSSGSIPNHPSESGASGPGRDSCGEGRRLAVGLSTFQGNLCKWIQEYGSRKRIF